MSTDKSKMADEQQEQLLRRPPANVAPAPAGAAGIGFSWLTLLGFAFLTFNSAMAIYRSDGDPAAIGFVAFSYVDLVLLFVCLRWYEREAPGSATRGKLKVGVWILTTLLTMAFSYKVAAIMPLAVKVVIWAMACATVLGGFYGFFVYTEKVCQIRFNMFLLFLFHLTSPSSHRLRDLPVALLGCLKYGVYGPVEHPTRPHLLPRRETPCPALPCRTSDLASTACGSGGALAASHCRPKPL
jgi:hypothetical protein